MVKSTWVRMGGKGPGNRSSGDEVHEEVRRFLGIWHSWGGDWGEGLGAGRRAVGAGPWKGSWVRRTLSQNCILQARCSPPEELPILQRWAPNGGPSESQLGLFWL